MYNRSDSSDNERVSFELMDAVFSAIPLYPKTIRLYQITNVLKEKYGGKLNGRSIESGNMASIITTMTYMYERCPFCEEEIIDPYTGRHHVVLSRLGAGDRESRKVLDIDGLRKQAMESGLLKWRDE